MKFQLVRYFTIASLVVFLIVAFSLNFVQNRIQTAALVEQEENQNINMTRVISNSIWPEFDFLINRSGTVSTESLKKHPEMQRIFNLTTSLLKGLPVIKVKAFNLEGRTVFSTQNSQVGEDKSQNSGFLSAKNGVPASALSHRDTFDAFDETISDRDVVSSYIPVYNPKTGKLEGVFEIYSDVTRFLAKLRETQYMVVAGIAGLLGLLFIALLVIVKRADQIIKQQDIENQKSRMQIAQSEKMASLGHMVASVAHELNTPLAFTRSNMELAVEGLDNLRLPSSYGRQLINFAKSRRSKDSTGINIKYTHKLLRETDGYEELTEIEDLIEMLAQTQSGLAQMSELVSHLKKFTRIDQNSVVDFNLNNCLENVLYIARSTIPEHITIHRDFGELPLIECMPSQLNQVFINLINNAAHAVDPVNGTISIRSFVDDGYIKVEVEDNGTGIPEKNLESIFEAYFTTKGVEEGTGLGLSISKEIVEQHHGVIGVRSSVGKGTTFTVQLPVQTESGNRKAA
ncbi:ATP-binding protein [Sedimenticola hydrogenitrophicus]|uniref:sensor histidine kinase n=1 Tax=Sedimenticola hydrogenitrophicus TaxID=2967975 RepID=UPI0021A4EA4F